MEVTKNFIVDGKVVFETNKKILGHTIFEEEVTSEYLTLYVVDSEMNVKAIITAEASDCQGSGFISGWSVKNL